MVQASRNPILERLTNLSVRFFPNSAGSPNTVLQAHVGTENGNNLAIPVPDRAGNGEAEAASGCRPVDRGNPGFAVPRGAPEPVAVGPVMTETGSPVAGGKSVRCHVVADLLTFHVSDVKQLKEIMTVERPL